MPEPPLGFVASALGELLGRDVSNQETDAFRRAFWAGDRSEASLECTNADWNPYAVLPDLWHARVENLADDSDQADADIVA
jgi:hypothetical protein